MRYLKPEPGARVRVTTEPMFPPNVAVGFANLPSVSEGTVLRSEKWDDPDSFRMTTGKSYPVVSVVTLRRIMSMEYLDGGTALVSAAPVIDVLTRVIKGSVSKKTGEANEYVVTKANGQYSCTCVGFQFHRTCKHIKQVKAEVEV